MELRVEVNKCHLAEKGHEVEGDGVSEFADRKRAIASSSGHLPHLCSPRL